MDVGLYGKLPSHGDFIRRRASDAFVAVWDAWLQDCLTASREALGDRWLDIYLTSPVWRFAAAGGACGPAPVAGVMAPSVDRVGRYFPLTIVAELPAEAPVVAMQRSAAPFFDRAERLVIDTLAAEFIDFEAFDQSVAGLAEGLSFLQAPPRSLVDPAGAAVVTGETRASWHLPLAAVDDLTGALDQLLSHQLSLAYAPLMLWWTDGSSVVDPCGLIVRGLPHPETFPAFLDGTWPQRGWRVVPARVDRPASEDLRLGEPVLGYRSAGASDVGRVRQINQDAFLERAEAGLWVVADGLGGHSSGEEASRMICDALADFVPDRSFDEALDSMRARLQEVNEHLIQAASRSLLGERCGSTVAVLFTRGARAAILWAGDSRVYRFRSGRLEQLTQDHSPAAAGFGGRMPSNTVTRAVGAQSTLELDLVTERVAAGDRFLLCSDGLTRAVPEPAVRARLESADIRAAADGLVADTLAAGAPDNVTVVVVEAYEYK